MTAKEFFEEWLAIQKVSVEQSTYEARYVYINKHIAPYFGETPVENITAKAIQQYCLDKLKNGRIDRKGGLSLVSVRKHLSIIKQAMSEAVIYGYIPVNPALSVRLPKKRNTKADRTVFLSAEEAQKMIDAFRGHQLFPVVVLAIYYGLRRSEVLGLKWSAVNFMSNTIEIRHTVVKNLTIEAKDCTKTETSWRVFGLLPEVRELLYTMYLSKGKPVDGYIFTWTDGRLFRPDYVTRGFQRILKSHGLPKMRFHDLRHSTASILFDMGWSLEDVKNWLGHADIETTSNIYLHYGRVRKILLSEGLSGTFKI